MMTKEENIFIILGEKSEFHHKISLSFISLPLHLSKPLEPNFYGLLLKSQLFHYKKKNFTKYPLTAQIL